MWPFGTSAKDRTYIEANARNIERLFEEIKSIKGSGSPGRYGCAGYVHVPDITTLERRIEELRTELAEVMEAAGLVRMVQPSKTWIGKKGKPNV
jgi:hypothetical protein